MLALGRTLNLGVEAGTERLFRVGKNRPLNFEGEMLMPGDIIPGFPEEWSRLESWLRTGYIVECK